jgi:hypothetical protein
VATALLFCVSGCASLSCPPFEASWAPGDADAQAPIARQAKLWLLHHGAGTVRVTSVLLDGVQQLRTSEVLELRPGEVHERGVQSADSSANAACRLPVNLVLECKDARFGQTIAFPNIMSPEMVRDWLVVSCAGRPS